MIGRREELAAILRYVDAMGTLTHTKNVIFVTGEAGMGKSTMLKEVKQSLAKRTSGLRPLVATTECSTPLLGQDVGEMEALQPWAQLMQQMLTYESEPHKKGE